MQANQSVPFLSVPSPTTEPYACDALDVAAFALAHGIRLVRTERIGRSNRAVFYLQCSAEDFGKLRDQYADDSSENCNALTFRSAWLLLRRELDTVLMGEVRRG